jgi:hypothetical protein
MRNGALPWAAFLLAAWPAPAVAQLISIRTVPISQQHQFDFLPSRRLAMGGLEIAIDDSLYDAFLNPAMGARVRASRFFGSPGVYSVSDGAGAGRTLPFGTVVRSGDWFGGGSLAVQQVDLSEPAIFAQQLPILPCQSCPDIPTGLPDPRRSNGNAYAHAMVGRAFPGTGLSFGASFSWAGLRGVDGVDLLYPGSARLRQHGYSLDLRVGALKEWAGDRALSAVLVHNRYASSHDVYYLDPIWDPGPLQFAQRLRLEENLDHTNTWGLHLRYLQPINAPGWRIGWVATTNVMSHPKIPNYEIQNIPRDPGNSEAFNFGAGISRSIEGSTFGFELLFEPIWSHTWADAAGPVETADGQTIPAGGKTIENRFRFTNAIARMGLSQELELDRGTKAVGLQLGLSIHTINYSLNQRDHVQATTRRLDEGWVEWSPTWGVSLRFPAWELRYRGAVISGTGRPGIIGGGPFPLATADGTATNILVAPSGPLTLTDVRVMTHQVSVSFPVR